MQSAVKITSHSNINVIARHIYDCIYGKHKIRCVCQFPACRQAGATPAFLHSSIFALEFHRAKMRAMSDDAAYVPTKYDSIFWIETDRITPNPYQPRREFDEERLKALGESIRQYGVLQPLVVSRTDIEKP